jgi:chemotaxis protein CheC
MKLSELEHDALVEVFNLGVGQAASALSQLAGEPVRLTVPKVELLNKQAVLDQFSGLVEQRISAVRQTFEGALCTEALLMFPAAQSLRLVQIMVGENLPLEDLGEMEQEALAEIGNILLNSVLACVSDQLELALEGSLPEVELGAVSEVLLAAHDIGQPLLSLQVRFEVASRRIEGYLVFVLDVCSAAMLKSKLAALIERLQSEA